MTSYGAINKKHGMHIAIAAIFVAVIALFAVLPLGRAHAANSGTPPETISGACYIGDSVTANDVTTFSLSSFSANGVDLSGATGQYSGVCADTHDQAVPPPSWAHYTGTRTGYSVEQGWAQYMLIIESDTYTYNIGNYQRVRAVMTIPWQFTGKLNLKKTSAQPSITNGNSCYSLEGAEYGVYANEADATNNRNKVATLTTGSNGESNSVDLEPGDYWVAETKAPAGYKLDDTPQKVTVVSGETNTLEVSDKPLDDPEVIKVTKYDADRDEAHPQAAASLEGAEYTFRFYAGYYGGADQPTIPSTPTKTWVMKTNSSGYASPLAGGAYKVSGDSFYKDENDRICIPLGTITCVETKAPTGYRLGYLDSSGVFHEPKVYISQIVTDNTTDGRHVEPVNYSGNEILTDYNTPINDEPPIRGNLKGKKIDPATSDGKAQGAATLAGAKIAVVNKNSNAVVSPEDGTTEVAYGGVVCTLTTDENGAFSTTSAELNGWEIPVKFGGCALPYGTYEVHEVAPPKGYKLNEDWSETITINSQGQVVTVNFEEEVIRGDVDLYKLKLNTQHPIANVPFVITSTTTGEHHVVVTDANGYLSTAADYKAHSANPNANDAAVTVRTDAIEDDPDGNYIVDESALVPSSGVWFSGRADASGAVVDDTVGGLPYDNYTFDEVRCTANASYKLVKSFPLAVTRDGWRVGPLTVNDNVGPTLATTLTDAEGTHSVPADGENLLSDAVTHSYFEEGTYLFKGYLHVVDADGIDRGVIATTNKQVNITVPDGVIDMGFVIDTSDYEPGTRFVAVEECYRSDGTLIAEHNDLADENQTVMIPEIKTTATDLADGDHELASADMQTIVDRVGYEGLTPLKQYTAYLTVHKRNADGTDGGVLTDADGKAVMKTQKFVPQTANGYVDISVSFTPDSGGYDAVVFEEIVYKDTVYAVHADISDASQTVSLPGIGTTATDTTTNIHVAALGDSVTINDAVAYSNVQKGVAYTIDGVVHIRDADGNDAGPLKNADGSVVTAQHKFTASEANGAADLRFECDKLPDAGTSIVIFETLTRDDSNMVMATHDDIGDAAQTVRIPSIATTAIEKTTGTHFAKGTSKFTAVDTVDMSNFEPAVEYAIHGSVHGVDADGNDAGEILDATGKPFTSSTTCTPESEDGKASLEFEIDPAYATGKIVVFEEVTVKVGGDDVVVAEHKDINDESQTIYVPMLATNAYDKESGTHNGIADTSACVVDETTYSGLDAGSAYTLIGTAMDKDTGEEFLDDGQKVTSELAFKAKESTGTVKLEFNINHTVMDGRTVVIFERLYDSAGNVVAVHEDINSAEQSVTYKAPSLLDKLGGTFDKTGYWFAQYWWVLLAAGIACLLIGAFRYMANDKESVFNEEE